MDKIVVSGFLVQGDNNNEWWKPTTLQYNSIMPLYKEWRNGLGQGGMAYPGTEIKRIITINQYNYEILIDINNSYMKNITHKNHTKRKIHFLPDYY